MDKRKLYNVVTKTQPQKEASLCLYCLSIIFTIGRAKKLFMRVNIMSERVKATFNYQKRIRELMHSANIDSYYQLGRMCEVQTSVVSRWLKKGTEVSQGHVENICRVFGITLAEFYSENITERRGDGNDKRLRLLWKRLTPEIKKHMLSYGEFCEKNYKELESDKQN